MELFKKTQIGIYEVERVANNRYQISFKSANNMPIIVELAKVETPAKLTKSDLMYAWVKNQWLAKPLATWWNIQVYAYDEKGYCWGWYNPQEIDYKRTSKTTGKVIENRMRICFDWMLEATEQNAKKILDEIVSRANADIKTVCDYKVV